MQLARLSTKDGAILYDPAWLNHPTEADFDVDALASAGRLRRAAPGRGRTWFVAGEPGDCVLRHYRRGGLAARVSPDRYWWTGAERTRPFRELRLLGLLADLGLPAPRPVAARFVRHGLTYRGDLLTAAIAMSHTLATLLAKGAEPALFKAVGACIRRFHEAGICHADLNAHNVLVSDRGAVHLVDFDRARRRAPGRWRQANLARLRRSLAKLAPAEAARIDEQLWPALLAGYA